MFRRIRISLALAFILSTLLMGAVHPAPTAAAGLAPSEAKCDVGGEKKDLLWVNGIIAFAPEDQSRVRVFGAQECVVSFAGKQVTYVVASPVKLALPGEGVIRTNRPFTYVTTTDRLVLHLPVADYSKFFVATFIIADTVDLSAPAQPLAGAAYFPETGHNLSGGLLAYWQANGGLAIYGYPLTEAFYQDLGGLYLVQYFERARFEYHPENAAPYDILLGQFGREVMEGRGVDTTPVPPGKDQKCQFAQETGQYLCDKFLAYWQANGGLAQFGFPLTAVIEERLEDGKVYSVQYFERARFEYHPENAAPYDILLGQFGRGVLGNIKRLRDVK